MEGPTLDAEEMAALRMAMKEAQPLPQSSSLPLESQAEPAPLIADDRVAERARPDGLRLGHRWASIVPTRISRLCDAQLEIERVGAEIVDGESLREEIPQAWVRLVDITKRRGRVAMMASGPVIEMLAARLLGAPDAAPRERPPSPVALRVFSAVGDCLLSALSDALRDEQGVDAVPSPAGVDFDNEMRSLFNTDVVLLVTLQLGGVWMGRLRLLARPETLLVPRLSTPVAPAKPDAIAEAVGRVPIGVRVELGRAKTTMAKLRKLQEGMIIPLDHTVDTPLTLFVGGVPKAVGKPIVVGGSLALEISDSIPPIDEPPLNPAALGVGPAALGYGLATPGAGGAQGNGGAQ